MDRYSKSFLIVFLKNSKAVNLAKYPLVIIKLMSDNYDFIDIHARINCKFVQDVKNWKFYPRIY